MGFKVGMAYSRATISAELGIDRDLHSVLVADDEVLAIVANTNGFNRINGNQYRNELGADSFVMIGENDGRGAQLETATPVRLFFAHRDDGYRYEGKVVWERTVDTEQGARREFRRHQPAARAEPVAPAVAVPVPRASV